MTNFYIWNKNSFFEAASFQRWRPYEPVFRTFHPVLFIRSCSVLVNPSAHWNLLLFLGYSSSASPLPSSAQAPPPNKQQPKLSSWAWRQRAAALNASLHPRTQLKVEEPATCLRVNDGRVFSAGQQEALLASWQFSKLYKKYFHN